MLEAGQRGIGGKEEGAVGGPGRGGVKFFLECEHNLLLFSSIPCMVMMH